MLHLLHEGLRLRWTGEGKKLHKLPNFNITHSPNFTLPMFANNKPPDLEINPYAGSSANTSP